jgi:hypothetical protein
MLQFMPPGPVCREGRSPTIRAYTANRAGGGNYFDPATRYEARTAQPAAESSADLTERLGHAFFLLVHGAGGIDYLVNGTLPPEGTVCDQDLVPFQDFSLSDFDLSARSDLIPMFVPEAVRKGVRSGD